MKGGFNNPPNVAEATRLLAYVTASMFGGFNNPPNEPGHGEPSIALYASMFGGFNNPPNAKTKRYIITKRNRFNVRGV